MSKNPAASCTIPVDGNKEPTQYIYGARDTTTGKLVSDITNPKRKYWDKRGNAQHAIDSYNSSDRRWNKNKGKHGVIELVKFELVEVPVED